MANKSHEGVVWKVRSVFVELLLSDLLVFIVVIFDLVLSDRVKLFVVQITGQLKVFFLEILLVLLNVVRVVYKFYFYAQIWIVLLHERHEKTPLGLADFEHGRLFEKAGGQVICGPRQIRLFYLSRLVLDC